MSRMREALPPNIKLIQNDAVDMGPFIVCGSRGWALLSDPDFDAADRKIYNRELVRLGLSLTAAQRLNKDGRPLVCMMHFPPMLRDGEPTGFTELLEKHGVSVCVYGHLHGAPAWEVGFRGEKNGVRYELCSADALGFGPKLIGDFLLNGGTV